MAMEALSHQLRASEYFIRRSKRGRLEEGDREELCFNEDDMELARTLMMLADGDKDVEVKVCVGAPPCTAVLKESVKVNGGPCYKCRVCGKKFGCFQALGGHKASHRKILPSGVISMAPAAEAENGESCVRVHECKICHKHFPSGQALGGHKRRHYEGPLGKHHNIHNDQIDKLKLKETNSNSEVATATNSDGGGTPMTYWGFDLNMPALPEFWQPSLVVDVEEEVQSPHPAKK